MTQGARATGMGLAFTAVANDPTAIFYNPAGLGWQQHFSAETAVGFISKLDGNFDGANPFPGVGANGDQHLTTFVVPTFFAVVPLTQDINLGVGVFAPYGLGFRWDNTDNQWPGRFISTNAVVQTVDLNPVLSWRLTPAISIAGGADYRLSKVQLERNNGDLRSADAVLRGHRVREVEQQHLGQQRLGLERGHHDQAGAGLLDRRLLPQLDQDRLRRDRDVHPDPDGKPGLRRDRGVAAAAESAERRDLDQVPGQPEPRHGVRTSGRTRRSRSRPT